MDGKLQELADRIYREGVEKGEARAREIIGEAEEHAAAIVSEAKREAERIISKAEKEAESMRQKAESDVRLSGLQFMNAFKRRIVDVITAETVDADVSDALDDPGLVKELVKTVVRNWKSDDTGSQTLEVLLPEKERKDLEEWARSAAVKVMSKGVEVKFSKNINGGFRIGPKDGGFKVSLTDEDFRTCFGGYLKPKTKEILFGE